eukprot:57854-Rhodomonas_salina.6
METLAQNDTQASDDLEDEMAALDAQAAAFKLGRDLHSPRGDVLCTVPDLITSAEILAHEAQYKTGILYREIWVS